LDVPSLGKMMSTCKLLVNLCRSDGVMINKLKLHKIDFPQPKNMNVYQFLQWYLANFNLTVAVDEASRTGSNTEVEKLVIQYNPTGVEFRPLLFPPMAMAMLLIPYTFLKVTSLAQDGEWILQSLSNGINFLGALVHLAFNPSNRHYHEMQQVVLITLLQAASRRGAAAKKLRRMMRRIGICELCQLLDQGNPTLQETPGHLYSLLAADDLIDFEHSLIGITEEMVTAIPLSSDSRQLDLPASWQEYLANIPSNEHQEAPGTMHDFSAGVWHFILFHSHDLYDQRVAVRAMVDLKKLEHEGDVWLAGEGIISGLQDGGGPISVIIVPLIGVPRILVKPGHLGELTIKNMQKTFLDSQNIAKAYKLTSSSCSEGTQGGSFTQQGRDFDGEIPLKGSWIAWRDTRSAAEETDEQEQQQPEWMREIHDMITQMPGPVNMVERYQTEMNQMDTAMAEDYKATINRFYIWARVMASNAFRLSRWAVCSVADVKVYENDLNALTTEILEEDLPDITTTFLRGPFETVAQHEARCRILFGTVKMLGMLKTQILKGFMSELHTALPALSAFIDLESPSEEQKSEIWKLTEIWKARFINCHMLVPGDPDTDPTNLGSFLIYQYNEVQSSLQTHAARSVAEDTTSTTQSMDTIIKGVTRRKTHSSPWYHTALLIGSITLLSAIAGYGAFKMGTWFGRKKQ
jgi:hypothetical protein